MTSTRFLSVQEVIAINVAMIQRYSPGELLGVKEPGLLESAVHRPQTSVLGDEAYPTIFEKAAALMVNHRFQFQEVASMIEDHCFFIP
ncbi:hypothetical protein LBW89_04415 [Paenibacillus sp. alder61]|nr:Fic family protein [Paenibacillus sp. alder61]MCA1292263.1 hypothetical protein [Paenibacillus sp. alder61]